MAIRRTTNTAGGKITAWSFSRLKDYLQCPLKCKLKHIDKHKEPGSAAMDRGTKIHEYCEDYVKGKITKLPVELDRFKKDLAVLRKGKAVAEADWAFRKDWTPTVWNDWNGCWVRVKADAILVNVKTGVIRVIDYKTGKPNADHEDQLSLYALAAFIMYPTAKKVIAELWYIDTGDKVESDYDVGQVPELKQSWERQVAGMFADTSFVAKPNNKCKWCWFRKENPEPGAPKLCKY